VNIAGAPDRGIGACGRRDCFEILVILADNIFQLARLGTLYDLIAPHRQFRVYFRPRPVMLLRTLQPIFTSASGSRVCLTTASVAEFFGLASVNHRWRGAIMLKWSFSQMAEHITV
jgi:hypothetical protein